MSNPPKVLPVVHVPYMTVIPGRRPETKVHKRISDAKNAFDTPKPNRFVVDGQKYGRNYTHGWGQLYEFKDGEWHLLFDVPKPTDDHAIPNYPYRESRPWRLDN